MSILFACPNRVDADILVGLFRTLGDNQFFIVTHLVANDIAALLADVPHPCLVIRADGDRLQMANWVGLGKMCPGCLDLRAIALRPAEELFAFWNGTRSAPASKELLTPFALEVVRSLAMFIANSDSSDASGFDIYLPTLYIRRFRVDPHPDCRLCAAPVDDTSSAAVLPLLSSPNKRTPRGYHTRDANEIELPIDSCVNPTCGMLAQSTIIRRHCSFTAQVSGYFRSPSASHRPVVWTGRGDSYRRSLIVGLLEGYERYAGLRMRSKRCTVYDSYRNLRGNAVHPRQLGLYDDEFYRRNPRLTQFSEGLKLRWVWGYSLTEYRSLLVPLQSAYYGDEIVGEPHFVRENSNGCASGTSIQEAIFFGLLELIERDAFVLNWNLRRSPSHIALDTLRSLKLRFLIDRLRRAGLDVYLLDARLDIPVPSIIAALRRRDNDFGTFAVALGCHFDPEEAMNSALTEVACRQSAFVARTRSLEAKLQAAIRNFTLIKTMEDHAGLYGIPEALHYAQFLLESGSQESAAVTYEAWNNSLPDSLDLFDDISHCLRLLALSGLKQVIVVDQTTPEQRRLGLYTARVLVPGIIPLDFGYGCSRAASLPRLYSIARQFGLGSREGFRRPINDVPHPFS